MQSCIQPTGPVLFRWGVTQLIQLWPLACSVHLQCCKSNTSRSRSVTLTRGMTCHETPNMEFTWVWIDELTLWHVHQRTLVNAMLSWHAYHVITRLFGSISTVTLAQWTMTISIGTINDDNYHVHMWTNASLAWSINIESKAVSPQAHHEVNCRSATLLCKLLSVWARVECLWQYIHWLISLNGVQWPSVGS